MSKLFVTIALLATLALSACGGTATVHGNGNATGGDGFRGNISPELDLNLDPKKL